MPKRKAASELTIEADEPKTNVYVIIAQTLFHGKIHGGSMPLGPCGLLAIDENHCPAWIDKKFDGGIIHAEDPGDANVKEIISLINNNHARVISNLRYMHVSTKATHALVGDDDSDSDSEN